MRCGLFLNRLVVAPRMSQELMPSEAPCSVGDLGETGAEILLVRRGP